MKVLIGALVVIAGIVLAYKKYRQYREKQKYPFADMHWVKLFMDKGMSYEDSVEAWKREEKIEYENNLINEASENDPIGELKNCPPEEVVARAEKIMGKEE